MLFIEKKNIKLREILMKWIYFETGTSARYCSELSIALQAFVYEGTYHHKELDYLLYKIIYI